MPNEESDHLIIAYPLPIGHMSASLRYHTTLPDDRYRLLPRVVC